MRQERIRSLAAIRFAMREKSADRNIFAALGKLFGDGLGMGDRLRGRAKHNAIFRFFQENCPTFNQSQAFPQIGWEAHSALRSYVDLNRHCASQPVIMPQLTDLAFHRKFGNERSNVARILQRAIKYCQKP